MKKLIAIVLPILLGLVLLGITIWLFFLAKDDNTYLLLFGLGTAILVPFSFSLLGFGFNFKKRIINEKISELSKISDIQVLLDQAKTTEEQIEILKTEYQNLEKNLRYNSEKISLELMRDALIVKAKEIIKELDSINNELRIIDDNISEFEIPLEVELLRQRVFKKQVAILRFKSRVYTFNRDIFPFSYGYLLFDLIKEIEKYQKRKLKKEIDKIASKGK